MHRHRSDAIGDVKREVAGRVALAGEEPGHVGHRVNEYQRVVGWDRRGGLAAGTCIPAVEDALEGGYRCRGTEWHFGPAEVDRGPEVLVGRPLDHVFRRD